MKEHARGLLLIAGIVGLLAGVVLMILGKIWGIFLLLLGLGMIAVQSAMMFRTGGYDPLHVIFNGLRGQGRQQSETKKMEYHSQNPDASVWDKLEE